MQELGQHFTNTALDEMPQPSVVEPLESGSKRGFGGQEDREIVSERPLKKPREPLFKIQQTSVISSTPLSISVEAPQVIEAEDEAECARSAARLSTCVQRKHPRGRRRAPRRGSFVIRKNLLGSGQHDRPAGDIPQPDTSALRAVIDSDSVGKAEQRVVDESDYGYVTTS